jgi:hypothetical protein
MPVVLIIPIIHVTGFIKANKAKTIIFRFLCFIETAPGIIFC